MIAFVGLSQVAPFNRMPKVDLITFRINGVRCLMFLCVG